MQINSDSKPKRINSFDKNQNKKQDKKVNSSSIFGTSFKEQIAITSKQSLTTTLDELIENIDKIARELAEFPTEENLIKYKENVRTFINKVLNSAFIVEKNFDIHNKLYILVREVDKKLIELTDDILNKHKKIVNLISRLQEIKGILLDMYI